MARTGRPPVKIDLDLAEKLGAIQCTMEEVSAVMDIEKSTLSMRQDFLDAYKKGKERGKMSLRRMQFEMAKKNATMAIWLGKQHLGQKDIPDIADEGSKAEIVIDEPSNKV